MKAGKSQRAALTVDVESGMVTITKKGSGSPEETIPQNKSKGLPTPIPATAGVLRGCGVPWRRPDARVMGCTSGRTPSPNPCGRGMSPLSP